MDYAVDAPIPATSVEATSRTRLPYEPKGRLLEFRRELAAACRTLHAEPGQVLHATYTSTDRSLVDIENVLTYNLGSGAIRAATTHGLVLERSYAPPRGGASHHYRYELVPSTTPWTNWRAGEPIATVELDALGAHFAEPKTGRWWLAARRGAITTHSIRMDPPAAFTLRISVTPPVGWRGSLAGLLKPLADGLVSALHVHTGPISGVLERAAAVDPTLTTAEFERLLSQPTPAALGGVRLVVLRGNSVQWLPADDRIVVLDAKLNHTGRPGHVVADLHSAYPLPHPGPCGG